MIFLSNSHNKKPIKLDLISFKCYFTSKLSQCFSRNVVWIPLFNVSIRSEGFVYTTRPVSENLYGRNIASYRWFDESCTLTIKLKAFKYPPETCINWYLMKYDNYQWHPFIILICVTVVMKNIFGPGRTAWKYLFGEVIFLL